MTFHLSLFKASLQPQLMNNLSAASLVLFCMLLTVDCAITLARVQPGSELSIELS